MTERTLFDAADITAARHRGNARSREAHAAVAPRKPTQRQRIVAYLREQGERGATCEEIAAALGMRYTSVSARLSEMKEPGWLAVAGRRDTTTGSPADVLRLTGREADDGR